MNCCSFLPQSSLHTVESRLCLQINYISLGSLCGTFGIQYFIFVINIKRPISWEVNEAKGSSASCLFSCIGLLLGLSPAALLAHVSDIQGICPQGVELNDRTTPSDSGIMDTWIRKH